MGEMLLLIRISISSSTDHCEGGGSKDHEGGWGPGYITHMSGVPNAHTYQPTHDRDCKVKADPTSLVSRANQENASWAKSVSERKQHFFENYVFSFTDIIQFINIRIQGCFFAQSICHFFKAHS